MRPLAAICGTSSILTAARRSLALTPTTPLTTTTRFTSLFATTMVDYGALTDQLVAKMKLEDDLRNKAYDRSWELNTALVRVQMAHEEVLSSYSSSPSSDKNDDDNRHLISVLDKEEESLDKLVLETALSPDMYNNIVHNPISADAAASINTIHARAPRRGNIDAKMENYARYKAIRYYLAHNELLPLNASCFLTNIDGKTPRSIVTDEEYLGGACIGLCHDLAKIAVSRASNAISDPHSTVKFVQDARDTVSNVLQELLEFDWRNSPLRRKYDSTKYALKTLETILYELSVAGVLGGHDNTSSLDTNEGSGGGDGQPTASKRMKIDKEQSPEEKDGNVEMETETSAIDTYKQEMAEIKKRMDHRDKLRENLIKTCRDGQKSAKNAIFALHRGNVKNAAKLLVDCENCVLNDLLPIVKEEPTLRGGSFSNVLEEYVEGKLFYCWLHGNDGEKPDNDDDKPAGKILMFDEINLPISVDEYLGGLCDLTGEIGRYAVARGTVRDKESVKVSLETSKQISMAIKMAGKLPGHINKKMNPLQQTVDKMERILYEQSLMEMAGRKFESSVENETVTNNAEDN